MPIEELLQPCTLITRSASGEVNDDGDETYDVTETETVCAIQQRTREERPGSGEASDTDWVAFFGPDESLSTADAVTQNGRTYEFVGDPWSVIDHELGTVHHIEASLRVA